MLVYKFDILKALHEAGYNTNVLRVSKMLSESTLQKLRDGKIIRPESINRICYMLDLQPGNLFKYVEDEEEIAEFKEQLSKHKKFQKGERK